jgi:hypothetical protein
MVRYFIFPILHLRKIQAWRVPNYLLVGVRVKNQKLAQWLKPLRTISDEMTIPPPRLS